MKERDGYVGSTYPKSNKRAGRMGKGAKRRDVCREGEGQEDEAKAGGG